MPELRLVFERFQETDGHTFGVKLVPSWGGQPTDGERFDAPLTPDDFKEIRWYLEHYLDLPDAGATVRAQHVEASLEEWGQRLLQGVVRAYPPHRDLLRGFLRDDAAEVDRTLTIATDDPGILHLPWELLADRQSHLCERGILIRR
jgi:hypothetical protein